MVCKEVNDTCVAWDCSLIGTAVRNASLLRIMSFKLSCLCTDEESELIEAEQGHVVHIESVRVNCTRSHRCQVSDVCCKFYFLISFRHILRNRLRKILTHARHRKKRYYDIILREVVRLSRLISDLMELSRLQSGNLAIEPDKFLIGETIEYVLDKYAAICQEKSIELTAEGDFDACPALYANPDRIEQLLGILIDNAVKYTPENGKITLAGDWSGERCVLSVSDTGAGISKEHLPHLFERFYKVDKAHSGMGSGLGLSIAKEMLELMGESILVESEEGKGTTFTFTCRFFDAQEENLPVISKNPARM